MCEKTKAQSAIAILGILVSVGLFFGSALSVAGGPSPTPGRWTMLCFVPFIILNPIYPLALLLFLPLSSGLAWLDLTSLGTVFWVIVILGSLYWWWFLGGIASRKLGRRRA
jgi:hypothetical protein